MTKRSLLIASSLCALTSITLAAPNNSTAVNGNLQSAAQSFFSATQAQSNFEQGVVLGLKNSLSAGNNADSTKPLAKALAQRYFPWSPLQQQYFHTMESNLTAAELTQATQFYQSDLGKKLVNLEPVLNTISVAYVQNSLHQHASDIESTINQEQFKTLKRQSSQAKASSLTQATLAQAYLKGIGTKAQPKQAFTWFTKAAKRGNPMAQAELAKMYDRGIGTKANPTRAVIWYHRAATQGDANAMYQIALHFSNGTGVPKDSKKAARWFQDSAMRSNICGKYHTGLNYLNGTGVSKDTNLAKAWLSAFAEVAYFTLEPKSQLKKIYDISNAYANYETSRAKNMKMSTEQEQAISTLQQKAHQLCA